MFSFYLFIYLFIYLFTIVDADIFLDGGDKFKSVATMVFGTCNGEISQTLYVHFRVISMFGGNTLHLQVVAWSFSAPYTTTAHNHMYLLLGYEAFDTCDAPAESNGTWT